MMNKWIFKKNISALQEKENLKLRLKKQRQLKEKKMNFIK